jgi:hypothetical protein
MVRTYKIARVLGSPHLGSQKWRQPCVQEEEDVSVGLIESYSITSSFLAITCLVDVSVRTEERQADPTDQHDA